MFFEVKLSLYGFGRSNGPVLLVTGEFRETIFRAASKVSRVKITNEIIFIYPANLTNVTRTRTTPYVDVAVIQMSATTKIISVSMMNLNARSGASQTIWKCFDAVFYRTYPLLYPKFGNIENNFRSENLY